MRTAVRVAGARGTGADRLLCREHIGGAAANLLGRGRRTGNTAFTPLRGCAGKGCSTVRLVVDQVERAKNRTKSKVQAKVEHPIGYYYR